MDFKERDKQVKDKSSYNGFYGNGFFFKVFFYQFGVGYYSKKGTTKHCIQTAWIEIWFKTISNNWLMWK